MKSKSLIFNNCYLGNTSAIGNKKEKEGPLGEYFDYCYNDLYCNCKTWEKSEIDMYKKAVNTCLDKENISMDDIDLVISGDLNNQIIIGSYALKEMNIPYFGVFSACASSVEGLILASSILESNNLNRIMINISSHNATAEKQFRYPLEYGAIKQDFTTSTVTIASSMIVKNQPTKIKITKGTIGRIKESFNKDSMDMARAMAPSAYDTLYNHLKDFNIDLSYYDLVLTGDLSKYGKELFLELLKESEIEIKCEILDAGELIYDIEKQKVFSGGSGCGCLPGVFNSFIINKMLEGKYKKVLLIATGALLNPIMCAQKESIPVISHAICLEVI